MGSGWVSIKVFEAMAGWVDEDRYNTEFDAAEYVEVTLAYGDMLLAQLDRNGAPVTFCLIPGDGPQTDAEDESFG